MQPMSLPKSTGHLVPALHQSFDIKRDHTPQDTIYHGLITNGRGRNTFPAPCFHPSPSQHDKSYEQIVRENLELRKQMTLLEQCTTRAWSARRKCAQTPEKRKRRVSKLPLIRLPPRTLAPIAQGQVDPSIKSTPEHKPSQLVISGPAVETYQRVGKDTSRRPMVRRTSTKSTQSRLSVTPAIDPGIASGTMTNSIADDASIIEDRSLSGILPLSIELPPITEFQFPDSGGSSTGFSYRTMHTEPPPFEIPRKKALPRGDELSTAWDGLVEPLSNERGFFPPPTELTTVPPLWPEPVRSSEGSSHTNSLPKDQSKRKPSLGNSTSVAGSRRHRLFSVGPLDRTTSCSARSSSCEQASQGIAVIPLAESMAVMSKTIRLPTLIGIPLASPIMQCGRAGIPTESEGLGASPIPQVDMLPRSPLPKETPSSDVPGDARRAIENYRKVALRRRRKSFARKQDVTEIDDTGSHCDNQSWEMTTSSHESVCCSEGTMEIDFDGDTSGM